MPTITDIAVVCQWELFAGRKEEGLTCYEAGFWEDCDAGDDGCIALDGLVVERQLYGTLKFVKDDRRRKGLRT